MSTVKKAIFDQFLTINEVAEAKGVNRRTVGEWAERGLIKAHKFGHSVFIEKDSVGNVPLHRKIKHRRSFRAE